MPDKRDVVIIGGGHNGLVTAFYLAKAGLKPLVLERRSQVGGAAITGGRASLLGTLLGVALLGMIGTALTFLSINPFWVQVITGVILLVAVLLNTVVNRWVSEWARTARLDVEETEIER